MGKMATNTFALNTKSLHLISRDQLLDTRICDLPLDLNHHWIRRNILRLNAELKSQSIDLEPHIWISDDWFSPDGVAGFAIPFFIAHPRLIALEKEMMGEAEGANPTWCMQLMRHEMGHAIDNAFRLRRNKRRQALFGLTSTPYPESYLPNKRSKDFVRHLNGHYAQAHPDEDWAETFALWLTPRSGWKSKYRGWNALKKLELVEEILTSLQGKAPLSQNKKELDHYQTIKTTLREYYRKKRIRHGKNKSKLFERDLKKIFAIPGPQPAWKLMEGQRRLVIDRIAKETEIQSPKIRKILNEVEKTFLKENLSFEHQKKNEMTEKLVHLIMDNTDHFFSNRSSHIIM